VKKILVAVKGEPTDKEICKIAAVLGKSSKSRIYIAYVIEVPRALPLDADIPGETEKGDKILEQAAEIIESSDLDVETDIIQARDAGPGIVDEARSIGVDLILLGMSSPPRVGQFLFGSTINYVLQKAHCPVIVFRDFQKT